MSFARADRIKGVGNAGLKFIGFVRTTKAVDLCLGCHDYPPPEHVIDAFRANSEADQVTVNQYTRGCGHPRLVNAIVNMYGRLHNRELNPMTEVLVTSGAMGSLFCSFEGLVNPGDEVILIEPFFPVYQSMLEMVGARLVFVPLHPPANQVTEISTADWKLDSTELASKFSSKTKLIVLNNPNNPCGKVYAREELQLVANLCIQHDVVCVADEVYEWITYPDIKHVRIATLPNMWERTISISSAGKTFSVTGWRLGWSIGPEYLINCLMTVHGNFVSSCCTPIQEAVAQLLEMELARFDDREKCYFYTLPNRELLPKRDRIVDVLRDVGMTPTVPQSSYYVLANWSSIGITDTMIEDGSDDPRSIKFCKWLAKDKKVAGLPLLPFYGPENKSIGEKYVRFCFYKKDETIDAAAENLRSLNLLNAK